MTNVMYDDVTLSLLPPGAYAYAGYVNGRFANFGALKAKFPKAHLLDISVFAGGDATCLDVETGDATIGQVFGWFKRQQARGIHRPVIYTQASNLGHLYLTMQANGFARGTYRVWSAHYTKSAHFCGASSCGFSIGGTDADATQWTDVSHGRSLDESLLADNFFAPPPLPPGMATQPTSVHASAKFTNATITWSGAKDVTGYWADLIDVPTGAHLDHVEIESTDGSGSYVFRHLKMKHEYKLGIYARPGVTGSHSQWVTITTK
jgi:hypothetical protein